VTPTGDRGLSRPSRAPRLGRRPAWPWLLFPLCAGALQGGCSRRPPAPGQPIEVDQACNQADGSRVRMTGHLRYRRQLLSFCSDVGGPVTCDLDLYATADRPADWNVLTPGGPSPAHASLSVRVGRHPGEMVELPRKFSAADVKLHLPDGQSAGDGARVTIDGRVSIVPTATRTPAAPALCFVTVDWAIPAGP
jgi:hypothetical protein